MLPRIMRPLESCKHYKPSSRGLKSGDQATAWVKWHATSPSSFNSSTLKLSLLPISWNSWFSFSFPQKCCCNTIKITPALLHYPLAMKTLRYRQGFVCHPASDAFHFLPVLTMMWFLDTVYCSRMHSSLTDLKVSFSLLLFPYNIMVLKMPGNPIHLLLNFFSNTFTTETATS